MYLKKISLKEQLRERRKEESFLLYLLDLDYQRSAGDIYKEIVKTLPAAFHYPDALFVDLLIDGRRFTQGNFRDKTFSMAQELFIERSPIGRIWVGYDPALIVRRDPSFFPEEEKLLASLARVLVTTSLRTRLNTKLERVATILPEVLSGVTVVQDVLETLFLELRSMGYEPSLFKVSQDKFSIERHVFDMQKMAKQHPDLVNALEALPLGDFQFDLEQTQALRFAVRTKHPYYSDDLYSLMQIMLSQIPQERLKNMLPELMAYLKENSPHVARGFLLPLQVSGTVNYVIAIHAQDLTPQHDLIARSIIDQAQGQIDHIQQIATLTAKYNNAQRQLDLFGGLAHDGKNELLETFTSLDEIIPTLRNKATRVKLQKLRDRIESLLAMFFDITDAYKLSIGGYIPKPVVVDSHEYFTSLLHDARDDSLRKSINLLAAYAVADIPSMILLDAIKVKRAFKNILSNAIKYTASGNSISVGIFVVHNVNLGQVLRIEVADTGIGMSAEEVQNIFNAEQRLQQADEQKGYGIGLQNALAMVKVAGGTILVESTLGRGSRFAIEVPLIETTDDFEFRPLSVLMIDDDTSTQRMFETRLKKLGGHRSDQAYTWESAYKLIAENTYDLIVVDLSVEHSLDGIEAIKNLRENTRLKKVPIIAHSATPSPDIEAEALANGFSGFVQKGSLEMDLPGFLREYCHCNPVQQSITSHYTGQTLTRSVREKIMQYPEVRDNFSPSEMKEFVDGLMENAQEYEQRINALLAYTELVPGDENWKELWRTVHSLKGMLWNVGFKGEDVPYNLDRIEMFMMRCERPIEYLRKKWKETKILGREDYDDLFITESLDPTIDQDAIPQDAVASVDSEDKRNPE